jgi:transposase
VRRRRPPSWHVNTKSTRTRVYAWKKQLLEHAARAFDPGVGSDAEADREREIEKLHAKIGQLSVERDFLAKRSGR